MNRSITRGAILLALIGAWVHRSPAQAPYTIEWQHCYGGSGAELAWAIDRTIDGGYVLAGHAQGYAQGPDGDINTHHGGRDAWIVKVSAMGTLEWEHCFGGSDTDEFFAVQQTADGGYIAAGSTSSWNSNSGDCVPMGDTGVGSMLVVKLASDGSLEWKRCLGGSMAEWGRSVVQTSDGGFLVAGRTSSNNGDVTGNHGGVDAWLVKLTPAGAIEWQRCFGGPGNDWAWEITPTQDGGHVVAGTSNSNDPILPGIYGIYDMWVFKIDLNGILEWERFFGGSAHDRARGIRQVADGGYIIAGETNSPDGDMGCNLGGDDIWLAKLTTNGSLEWSRCFGGSGGEYAHAVMQTTTATYRVAGRTHSMDGDVLGHYGNTNGDAWLLEIAEDGELLWQRPVGGSAYEIFYSMAVFDPDGSFLVAGGTGSIDGDLEGLNCSGDMWVVKLAPLGVGSKVPDSSSSTLTLFPNPTTNTIHIQWSGPAPSTLEVLDMTGRLVYGPMVTGPVGEAGYALPVGALPAGLYAVRVQSATGSSVQRFVKE
jgi:hypothetical protein